MAEIKTVLAGMAIVLVAMVCDAATVSAETFQWLQYVPDGLEARVITDQAACPTAQIDGAAAAMMPRAAPGGDYPITVCALPIPAGAKAAAIAGNPVALPSGAPKRIAVIGDTGCRLKGNYWQACNDPQQWPFREIAENVARSKPDLVIHVGDYHYRETPCPDGQAGCAGSPFGDNWDVWKADFFAPAASLLNTAPWVVVRGNHEECKRGGRGWSRTLEPYPFDATAGCNGDSKPYLVTLPDLTLAVVDVSRATENGENAKQVQSFRAQYQTVAGAAGNTTWVLQHKPIWSPGGTLLGVFVGDNKTLAAAATGVFPSNVTMLVSGHHHLFQVLTYDADLPTQVVSGHGGDNLNPGPSEDPAGWVVNGVRVKSGLNTHGQFGFALLDKGPDGWDLTDRDVKGAIISRCAIAGRAAVCRGG